jgi:hypothetical protein
VTSRLRSVDVFTMAIVLAVLLMPWPVAAQQPEIATTVAFNNAFGGPDMKTLYVTAGKTLYKVRTEIAGRPR